MTTLRQGYPELYSQLKVTSSKTEEVTKGSSERFTWVCDKDQRHEWEASVKERVRGRGCSVCAGKSIIIGVNDLETTHPQISKELLGNPKELTARSSKKVQWKCSKGHIYEAVVSNRTKDNPSGCSYCTNRKVLKGFNDIQTTHPELASEIVGVDPTSITAGSNTVITWRCSKGHTYKAKPNGRVQQNSGCNYCYGRGVWVGETDLQTTHPELSVELVGDPRAISGGSHVKVLWECSEGHRWETSPGLRTQKRGGTGCPECAKGLVKSRAEELLFEHISGLGLEVIGSDREVISPKELDIYIPSKKVAIEYNGLYWHSEKFRHKDSHKEKYELCLEKGIQLIQIWGDDLRDRPQLVFKMLEHKLGVSRDPKVFARKTVVVPLSAKDSRIFLDDNHIQGAVNGSIRLGLKYQEELVAVMVLTRTGHELRLERYATSCHVVGGQSKLLKFIDTNFEYESMITFADLTVSNGNLYESTGWVKDKVLPPDYAYLYRGSRVHKFNFRLERFKRDTNLKFVDNKTERELAELNNLLRVYDAGKVRYRRYKK